MVRFFTFIIIVLMMLFNYKKRRLVSSGSLWLFCYLLIFVLYPTVTHDVYKNTELIDICALCGITAYSAGVLFSEKIRIRMKAPILYPKYHISAIMYWGVMVIFFGALIYMLGVSGLVQVLTGQVTANELTFGNANVNVNILIYIMNLMVPFVLAVWISANGKFQKKMKYFYLGLYIITSIIFSYTRLYLVCVLVIIIFYQVRKLSVKKQTFILAGAVLAIVAAMVLLNFIRYIGAGNINRLSSMLDISYVLESTDFCASYKWFDELLSYGSPYIVPLTYFKPLFVFIPRSIWANKPEPLSLDILRLIDPELIEAGYSTAGNSVLGEGFAILGYVGIILFPFIWGITCNILDRKYYYRISIGADRCLSNIFYYIYSVFIILSAQRGDWSQYMVIVIWLFMVPLYIVSKFIIGNLDRTT